MEGGILPSRQELLSRIELVIDLDSSFIALTGDSGIGKSTVLEYFIEHHCQEHRKCFIQAVGDQTDGQIKEQILLQLFRDQAIDSRLTLAQNLAQLTFDEPQRVIIIIDNGQYLDTLAFGELIGLLNAQIDNFQASVIFALSENRELFSQLNAQYPLIEIHVEPLNRAESRSLLEFYYQEMMDSDRQEVQRFVERCDGNPANLLKWQSDDNNAKSGSGLSGQSVMMVVAAFILLSVAGAASWYFVSTSKDTSELKVEQLREKVKKQEAQKAQHQLEEEQKATEALDTMLVQKWDPASQKQHVDKAVAAAAATIAAQEAAEQATDTETSDKDETVLDGAQSAQAQNDGILTQAPDEQAQESSHKPDEVKGVDDSQHDAQQQAAVEEKTEQQSEAVAAQTSENKATLLDKMDNPWFMAQKGDAVVLQLTGVSNQSTLQTYLNYHKLGDQAHVYQSVRNGKPWYVVTAGIYDSLELANAAKGQLPETLRSGQPWAKYIRTIQTEILNADKKDQ